MQENRVIPRKPKGRKKIWEYYDKNKEAILADYSSMTLNALYEKWGMATTTWIKLKKKWGIPNKGKTAKEAKPASQKQAKTTKADDVALTEHERYLILLGYQMGVRDALKIEQ